MTVSKVVASSPGNPAEPLHINVLVIATSASNAARIARCLDRAGMRPCVLGWDQVRAVSLIPECRAYIAWKNVRWENGELHEGLLAQLNDVCRAERIDIIVPADYDTTLFLSKHQQSITQGRPCLIPRPESITELHDKWKLSRRMARLGLSFPACIKADSEDMLLSHGLRYPIVTKPLALADGAGFQIHADAQALRTCVQQGRLTAAYPLLVQEFIDGRDIDFSFLAVEGRIIAHSTYAHEHGARMYFEDPRLEHSVQRLLADDRYTGVGHLDTRYDPQRDEYFILEINPRFWGSLLYELAAGVNYPALCVAHAVTRQAIGQTRADPGRKTLTRRDQVVGRLMVCVEKCYAFKYAITSRGWGLTVGKILSAIRHIASAHRPAQPSAK